MAGTVALLVSSASQTAAPLFFGLVVDAAQKSMGKKWDVCGRIVENLDKKWEICDTSN